MKRALKLVKAIANARPEIVRFLFKKYGITAEVSELSLVLAIQANGKEFIKDLMNLISGKTVLTVNATGDDGTTILPVDIDSTDWMTNTGTWVNSFSSLLNTIANAGSSVWSTISGFGVNSGSQLSEQELLMMQMQYDLEAQQRKQQTIMLVVGGLVAVAIIFAIIYSKKK
jgi:hypothetical protein